MSRPPIPCCDVSCSEHHEAGGGQPPSAAPAADGTVVVGSLANSYATYQLRLSGALAKEHHELRWGMPGQGMLARPVMSSY